MAALLVDGASNKVIARALDISVHTAKFHVTAILEKLGARNRADAVDIPARGPGDAVAAGSGAAQAPVTRQITSPTSSAISTLPSRPSATPTGRP